MGMTYKEIALVLEHKSGNPDKHYTWQNIRKIELRALRKLKANAHLYLLYIEEICEPNRREKLSEAMDRLT